MKNLEIQLRILKARLKAQLGFSLNIDMQVASQITKAEIEELERIIAEEIRPISCKVSPSMQAHIEMMNHLRKHYMRTLMVPKPKKP